MVQLTGKLLELTIKVAAHEHSNKTPSAKNALEHARSAFIEAEDFERECFKKLSEPEGDENQVAIPMVAWKNEQPVPVVARDEISGATKVLGVGEEWFVTEAGKVSWTVYDQSAEEVPAEEGVTA